jgi:mono/diheme cytochrome c family protein
VRRFLLLMTLAVLPTLLFSADAMAQVAKPKAVAKTETKTAATTAATHSYPLLPQGPGRDVEVRVCGQCHTPERPSTQRHDLAGWNGVLDQMATNGAQASDAEFDQIAAYLTKSFPPGKPLPAAKK